MQLECNIMSALVPGSFPVLLGGIVPFDGGLLTNGGFEDGLTGWDPLYFGGGLTGITTGTGSTAAADGPVMKWGPNYDSSRGVQQIVTIVADTDVTVAVKAFKTSGAAGQGIVVRAFTGSSAAPTTFTEHALTGMNQAGSGVLHDLSATFTPTAGHTICRVVFYTRSVGDIDMEVDNCRLTQS